MAIIPKYWLISSKGDKVIGSANDLTNIVNQWHRTGELGTIVKTVTWKTELIDITDQPLTPKDKKAKEDTKNG